MSNTATESRQIVGRYLQALSGQQKTPELVARFVSDAGLATHIRDIEAAFPEYELVPDELVAEGSLVAMRATFRGVHLGPFAGIAPTGRSVAAGLMIFYRLEGGRIAEHWMQFDSPTLLAQLQPQAAHA